MNKVKAMAALAMSIATFGTSSVMAHAMPMYYPEETQIETRGNSYNWGRHAIRWAYADGVTVGKTDGKFDPDQPITRAEAVTMLTKIKEIDASKYSGDSKVFNDVNGAWYTSYVNAAYENGFVVGKGKGVFAPNDTLTRAEAATMIVNACGYKQAQESKNTFTDISNAWYTDYIKAAYDNKIVSGKSEKTFDPNGNVTRAEYVMMLYNSVMGVNEKGIYCAVMINTGSDSFQITNNGEVLLSYNEDDDEVKGATKVTDGDDWKMAYFTPTDSFEIEFADGKFGFMRIYAYGKEYSIFTTFTKKVVFNKDGSVVCYPIDDAEMYPDMEIHTTNNMKLEVANGEACIVGQKFENGFEMVDQDNIMDSYNVRHKNSEFIKFTPVKENSTIELGIDFAKGGEYITGIYNEEVYFYLCDDGSKRLQIKNKMYNLDLKADNENSIFSMYGCDYDQDGQKDYLISVLASDDSDGLYVLNVKDDKNVEAVKISDGMVNGADPSDHPVYLYSLKGKTDEVIFCYKSEDAIPVSIAGTDLMEVNLQSKELYKELDMEDNDKLILHCSDYDGDGQEEYAIEKAELFPIEAESWDVDKKATLYMIDQFDGAYKAVQCPKLNIDDLPITKAAIEAREGFAGFVDHTREFYYENGSIACAIDFYQDIIEEGYTLQEMVHYEDIVEYHADGTFSFDDSGMCPTSVGCNGR